MFLPIKAEDKRGNTHIISGMLDGDLFIKDHKEEYCLIKLEDWNLSRSLKDYSELTEDDWLDIFEAYLLYPRKELRVSLYEDKVMCSMLTGYSYDSRKKLACFYFEPRNMFWTSKYQVDQLEAFRVLIEKRKL